MRKAIVALAALAILAAVNVTIASRETILASGRVVLLELAPVDPRSLMQGDYMALRFRIADSVPRGDAGAAASDGRLVLAVGPRGIATFRRLDDGSALAQDEARLRYRIRDNTVKLATNAFFFEEGQGGRYASAQYGEFRVAPDGEALLTGLRDRDAKPL